LCTLHSAKEVELPDIAQIRSEAGQLLGPRFGDRIGERYGFHTDSSSFATRNAIPAKLLLRDRECSFTIASLKSFSRLFVAQLRTRSYRGDPSTSRCC
jgi:hypothetical protein